MIDDTTRGAALEEGRHCCVEIGQRDVPAAAGTSGPHDARKARTRASASASRRGGGSGNPGIDLSGPLLCAVNARTQSGMPARVVTSAPSAPMPPALATATDRPTGQAPAIGASRIGEREDRTDGRRPVDDDQDEKSWSPFHFHSPPSHVAPSHPAPSHSHLRTRTLHRSCFHASVMASPSVRPRPRHRDGARGPARPQAPAPARTRRDVHA